MRSPGKPGLWALFVLSSGLLAYPGSTDSFFTELTAKVGLEFCHDPGDTGKYVFPENMGPGAAFLDYDNDGDLDVYLIQGGGLPEPKSSPRKPNRLFRQEESGAFTDVTSESGLGDTGYGMGVAVGDIDNDGYLDV